MKKSTGSSDNSITNEMCFMVIEFLEKNRFEGKKKVEVVPSSWVFESANDVLVRFPPRKDHPHLTDWVKSAVEADLKWKSYPIKVLSKTSDLEQALRRLDRSYTQADLSSDDTQRQPKKLSRVEVKSLLYKATGDTAVRLKKPKSQLITRKITNQSEASDESEDELTESEALEEVSEEEEDTSNALAETSKPAETANNSGEQFEFLQKMFSSLEESFSKKIENAKRSMMYDFKKEMEELKTLVLSQNASSSRTSPWKILDASIPFDSVEAFEAFDEQLTTGSEKEEAFKLICQLLTGSSKNGRMDVNCILSKFVSKNVQLQYSGAGRKVKNQPLKKSFSSTATYKIMEEFLQHKYKGDHHQFKVLSATSAFLSGAKDRDGGRAHRE